MTIIEKIKQSVEGATGMPFLYHAAGELNELIARCGELPVAYSFLIDSGTIDDVNGRYHERVTLAVMFCDKTDFDFNALENEQIIDRMKVKAYKWMQSLRMSNALHVVSVNNTQRLYDNTTDILTGFAVNITVEDIEGVGECELPQVVIDVDKNGSYDVVGVDKVRVNVVPKLEELDVTQNGEYLPPTDIAGFSKVSVDVQLVLEELTITQNGEYTPQEGVDGFSKVTAEFDTSSLPKIIVTNLLLDQYREQLDYWDGRLIDVTYLNNFNNFARYSNIKEINIDGWECIYANFDFNTPSKISAENCFYKSTIEHIHGHFKMKVKTCGDMFREATKLKSVDVTGIDVSETTSVSNIFKNCNKLEQLDLTTWVLPSNRLISNNCFSCRMLNSVIGGRNINDVLQNDIAALKNNHTAFIFSGTILDRASLRAIINGLADLTGQTAQTLTLGATLMAKLTEEDIAIAVSKNWTIV